MLTDIKVLRMILLEYLEKYRFRKKQYLWKKQNSHNFMTLGGDCDLKKIKVGKHSYGNLCVVDFLVDNERIEIGNYVSVAPNVKFVLGGNHPLNTFTSYPLRAKFFRSQYEADALTKGPIIVEDEAWIGMSAIILSGVKIGRGAVVAAGSVVTKDVPPFAVVAGNPARIIRKRHSPDIEKKLSQISLSSFTEQEIKKNIDYFYMPVENSIEYLIAKQKNTV